MEEEKRDAQPRLPIKHWSHSSLMAYLRNPLAWYKRYVEEVYDQPAAPSSIVGRAGHKALEYFYSGAGKDIACAQGLAYLRAVPDFEINFGRAKSRVAQRAKRAAMEREYLQAIGHYLARPPRHKVLGVEMRGLATVPGLPLPLKAVSDLVVESRIEPGALDIVDHKFVDAFSVLGAHKTAFLLQALFNYYTVAELFGRPVRRFLIYECKKSKNARGGPQLRRHIIDFREEGDAFAVFHRLIRDATAALAGQRIFLPNPSDMFEGENSFDIYRLRLVDDEVAREQNTKRER